MNNYEYIIASLPVLSSDFRGSLDYESIVSDIAEQLSGKDRTLLETLLDGFDSDKLNREFYDKALASSNSFIKGYFEYDLCVRNLRVEFINRNLSRPEGTDTITILSEDFEFEDSDKVAEILAQSDILKRERGLDDLMWAKIDELCGMQVFSIDVILGFTAKLQIIARWLKLDPQTGRELFKQLVNEIRNNKKSIE